MMFLKIIKGPRGKKTYLQTCRPLEPGKLNCSVEGTLFLEQRDPE